MKRKSFYITGPALLFTVFLSSYLTHRLEERVRLVKSEFSVLECRVSLNEVQKKPFELLAGKKVILTASVQNFNESEDCWIDLELLASEKIETSQVGVVYIFTLPENKVREIKGKYDNFDDAREHLVASYSREQGGAGKFVKY